MLNKYIFATLFLIAGAFTSLRAQTSLFNGAYIGGSSSNVTVKKMTTNGPEQKVIVGTFKDSVDLDPNTTYTYTVFGGSSTVHNAFVSKLDSYNSLIFGFALGNTTDSVTIHDVFLNQYGDVIIAGSFSGTVNFDPLFTVTNYSSVSGHDGFIARYTGAGNLDLFSQYIPSAGGDLTIMGIFQEEANSSIYFTGHFSGTIDIDPSGTVTNITSSALKDGFIGHLTSAGFLMEYKQLQGAGNAIPTKIWVNKTTFEVLLGGYFTSTVNTNVNGGTNNLTSAGLNDMFYTYYDNLFNIVQSFKIGGTGNDVLKDMFIDANAVSTLFLIEFENTINLNPSASSLVTSAGGTDVAYARYSNFGTTYVCGGRFGNAANNQAFGIYGNNSFLPPRSMASAGFAVALNFSGIMDFDPSTTNDVLDTASNTTINAAIINLDSLGNLIYHGTIEADDIVGYRASETYLNNIVIAGNFNGTNCDLLPYNAASVFPGTYNAGYLSNYNRCHMTSAQGSHVFGAYECGTNTAQLKCDVDEGTYAAPLSYFWNDGGDFISYEYIATGAAPDSVIAYTLTVTDAFDCTYYPSPLIVLPHPYSPAFSATVTPNPTLCGQDFGSAAVTYAHGIAPISYYWSNGDTTSLADSLIAGNYFVRVTDSLQCYTQVYFDITNSNGPNVSVSTSNNPACFGDTNGNIDITVTGGATPYTFLWSNGATTEDLTSVGAGNYTVFVTDANGCTNTTCVDLTQPDQIYIYFVNSIFSDCGASTGAIQVDAFGGQAPYTFQWSPSAYSLTGDSIVNIPAGIHTVTVTDNMGCSTSQSYGIASTFAPYSYVNNFGDPACNGSLGFIDVETFGTAPYIFQWSTGQITEDISNLTDGGNYLLQVTDNAGCIYVLSAYLSTPMPNTPTVCLTGVDSTGTQNVVVWDESTTPEADYYKIYREGFCNSDVFGWVGTVQHEDLSVFYDTVVNTDTRSWHYYVTAVDSCGNESYPSVIHKTVHLSSQLDANNDIYLQWDNYVGRPIGQYRIFRSNPAATAFTAIDSVDSFTLDYVDTGSFAGYDSVLYYVEAVPEFPCTGVRAYNQNASRTNNTRIMVPMDTTSVETINYNNASIRIYPNPTNEMVNISIKGVDTNWDVRLFDAYGRLVKTIQLKNNAVFSARDLRAGVYIVQLTSADATYHNTQRLIVSK